MLWNPSKSAAAAAANDPTPRPQRPWAPAQEEVFAAVVSRASNLSVEAVAGSGKTTTLIESLFRYRDAYPTHKVLFVAFAKSIADELRSRVPRGVTAQTLHSLGLAVIRRDQAGVDVEQRKPYYHARDAITAAGGVGDRRKLEKQLVKALSAFYTQTEPMSADLADFLQQRFDLDYALPAADMAKLLAVMDAAMRADRRFICFDEMLTWAVQPGRIMPRYDLVMVDEAQDLNPMQEEMLARIVTPSTRVVFVGDPNQSIYAFRGASHTAMSLLQSRFSTQGLPLSVSYRCPKAVVALAQSVVPRIQSADLAEAGEVIRNVKGENVIPHLPPASLVLGRRNSTVVRWCLWLGKSGVRARMLGRDIGGNVMAPVEKMVGLHPELSFPGVVEACHTDLLRRSSAAAEAGDDGKSQKLSDLAVTVQALASDCPTFGDFEARINDLFVDEKDLNGTPPILCSSIHRAKGREADVVVWLEPGFSCWIKAKLLVNNRAAEAQQEDNIRYVAMTRARKTLYLIEA
jgi:superfamily I DNA/RNA helicase